MMVLNVDSGNGRLVGYGNLPSWSPDSRKVVFSFMPSAELGDRSSYIFTRDLASGSRTQVTYDPGFADSRPEWSPDGTFIYFSSNRQNAHSGISEIYRVNADGSELTRVTYTDSGYSTSPGISTSGQMIAYVSDQGGISTPGIFVRSITGLVAKLAIQSPIDETFNYPRWSPDDKELVFVGGWLDGSGRTSIHLVGTDGGNFRTLEPFDSTATSPDW